MSPKVYACLLQAFTVFAESGRPWTMKTLQAIPTGEGTPSKYQMAIRQGWMRVVGDLIPKFNNQYVLTTKGANTVIKWHEEGFSVANPPPRPQPIKVGIMNYKDKGQ